MLFYPRDVQEPGDEQRGDGPGDEGADQQGELLLPNLPSTPQELGECNPPPPPPKKK